MHEKKWHYIGYGGKYGPLTESAFIELIETGEIKDKTLVWRDEYPDWVEARDCHEFQSCTFLPLQETQTTETVDESFRINRWSEEVSRSSDSTNLDKVWNNYIARHWNGQHSLAWAWWFNGVFLNFLVSFFGFMLDQTNLLSSAWSNVIFLCCLSVFCTWQAVGIFRAARLYIFKAKNVDTSKRRVWGQLAAVLIVLGSLVNIGTYGPLLLDSLALANALSDDEWNQYYIEYEGETGIVLNGYIHEDSVRAVIDAFEFDSNRTGLILNSPGGLLHSAFKMADYIDEYDLVVVARGECISACVLLLASAKTAAATPETEIIFHNPESIIEFTSHYNNAAGLEEEEEYYNRFYEYGVPTKYIDKYKLQDFTSISIEEAYEASIISDIWNKSANQFLNIHNSCISHECAEGLFEGEASSVSVFDLKSGMCFDDVRSTAPRIEVVGIPLIDCITAHDNEVMGSFELSQKKYLGSEKISIISRKGCISIFESYIGLDYYDSGLEFYTLKPTTESWGQGDREVICIAYDMSQEKLTGSIWNSRL